MLISEISLSSLRLFKIAQAVIREFAVSAMDNQHDDVDARAAVAAGEGARVFECIENGFPLLQTSDVKQKLLQWNLDSSLKVQRFRVLQKITKENEVELIEALFQNVDARKRLGLHATPSPSKPLCARPLRATVTSLMFFDKLVDAKIVTESGALRRCLDEVCDGATASDLLKESFINPESEHADVFTGEEQHELIFQLFRAFVIGGSMCQSDETLAPYEDMTKQFYKALVSVKKNAADPSSIDITSRAYLVEGSHLFDSSSRFSSCFVVIDAKKRWLTLWHNAFVPFW